MKRQIFDAMLTSAALLVGCAESEDYGRGSAGEVQSESSSAVDNSVDTTVSTQEPRVAPEPGTAGELQNESVESRYNTLGSAASTSANVPMNVATNMTEDSKLDTPDDSVGGSADNEQGTQTSPEPNTGDDANPDSLTPDGE